MGQTENAGKSATAGDTTRHRQGHRMISKRYCRSTNYSPLPCKGEPDHDVVYVTSTGRVLDRSPACRLHAIAEQARHQTSGNIATCHVVAPDGNVVHA